MVIRKQYKFEAAHKVRNCASNRCSKNIHGHSFITEVMLTSKQLDNGGKEVDFELLDSTIGTFMSFFDHSLLVWREDEELWTLANQSNTRICLLPINTTAENLSKIIFMAIYKIFQATIFNNEEQGVEISSVRVHETATEYAECTVHDITKDDWEKLPKMFFKHIHHNHEVLKLIRDESLM